MLAVRRRAVDLSRVSSSNSSNIGSQTDTTTESLNRIWLRTNFGGSMGNL